MYLAYVWYSVFPKIDVTILRNPLTSSITSWLKETEKCMNEIEWNKNNNNKRKNPQALKPKYQ